MIFERNQRKIERFILIKSKFDSSISKYVLKKTEKDLRKNRRRLSFLDRYKNRKSDRLGTNNGKQLEEQAEE